MSYEMLTGRLPFQAETAWEWATQHMTAQPIPIESMAEGLRAPEAMRNAVRRALEKAPNARFQTVKEFNDAFCGQGAFVARPAMTSNPSVPDRPRTEVGEPLDVGSAFAPSPGPPMGSSPGFQPMGPPMGGMVPMGPAYTPAGGNVAYPTPAGIPQSPVQQKKGGGGGRTVLLVLAGVIGVASVVGIVFAVKGTDSSGRPAAQSSNAPTATATATATATTPVVETATTVPPLNTTTHPTATPTVTSHPSTPPRYNGPECARARQLRTLGHAKEAESWALACIAKGGNPN
jgi:serine/threonine-protein kinase